MHSEKQPLFSIITATYKRPLLLMRTINSVMSQTFGDYEHIIIDDANDDETEKIVNQIDDKRIVLVSHSITKGAAAARNSGIKIAKGNLILFLDDDDEYLPELLEKMFIRFSKAGKNVGFIWTGISRILDSANGEQLISLSNMASLISKQRAGVVCGYFNWQWLRSLCTQEIALMK